MRVNRINGMGRILLIAALLLVFLEAASHENEDEIIERDIKQLLQIAIDAPRLQQYYHISEKPERAPPVLKLPDLLSGIFLIKVENLIS